MDFNLSEQQQAGRDLFARFCDAEILPRAAALDEAHAFPRELFGELAKLGFFGMRYPEPVGGTGMNLLSFCLALAEIARGSVSLAGAAAMQSLMGTDFLHRLGNADMHERLFKPALRGEKIGDITHQRKLEDQLRQSQKLEAVGQLAGGVAHDFNNILTAIMGYGNLVLMKMRDDDQLRQNVEHILSAAERAAQLTQGLLAYSRRQILNPQPVNLNELIRRVKKLLERLISEEIELKTILT